MGTFRLFEYHSDQRQKGRPQAVTTVGGGVLLVLSLVFLLFCGCFFPASAALRLGVYPDSIHALVPDPAGRVWIGTYGRGLWVYDRGNGSPFPCPEGFDLDPRISKMLVVGSDLYLATAGGGCRGLDLQTMLPTALPSLPDDFRYLHALFAPASGGLYVGSVGTGTAFLPPKSGAWRRVPAWSGQYLSWVNDFAEWNGYLWAACQGGLFRAPADDPFAKPPKAMFVLGEVNRLFPGKNFLLVGTMNRGAFRVTADNDDLKIFATFAAIHAIVQWHDRFWFAGDAGLWVTDLEAIEATLITDFLPSADAPKSLTVSANDQLLIGTLHGRLFATQDGRQFQQLLHISRGRVQTNQ